MNKISYDLGSGELNIIPLTLEEETAQQDVPSPQPNWDMLYGRLLAYDLKPIFESIKVIAKTDTAINWDLTALATALSTVRTEQALRDCLDELIEDGCVISDAHKLLWNNAITELNFSDLVRLL